jgi:hypothetical protein
VWRKKKRMMRRKKRDDVEEEEEEEEEEEKVKGGKEKVRCLVEGKNRLAPALCCLMSLGRQSRQDFSHVKLAFHSPSSRVHIHAFEQGVDGLVLHFKKDSSQLEVIFDGI